MIPALYKRTCCILPNRSKSKRRKRTCLHLKMDCLQKQAQQPPVQQLKQVKNKHKHPKIKNSDAAF